MTTVHSYCKYEVIWVFKKCSFTKSQSRTMKSEKFVGVPIKCVSCSDTNSGLFVVSRLSADNRLQKVKVFVSRSSVYPVRTQIVARSLYPDSQQTTDCKKLKFLCPDEVCVPFYTNSGPFVVSRFMYSFFLLLFGFHNPRLTRMFLTDVAVSLFPIHIFLGAVETLYLGWSATRLLFTFIFMVF